LEKVQLDSNSNAIPMLPNRNSATTGSSQTPQSQLQSQELPPQQRYDETPTQVPAPISVLTGRDPSSTINVQYREARAYGGM